MSSDSELEQEVMESGSEEEGSVAEGDEGDEFGSEEGSSVSEGAEDDTEEDDSGGEEFESALDQEDDEDDTEEDIGDDAEETEISDSDEEMKSDNDEEIKSDDETKSNDDDDDDDDEKQRKVSFNQQKIEKIKEKLLQKYEKQKGKCLFILFPHRLNTDKKALEEEVKGLCKRIIRVRRPRQKSVRFCLVDFDSEEDRNKALKELSKIKINGKKLIVRLPKTEKEEVVEQIINNCEKRLKEKTTEKKIKKIVKEKKMKKRTYTSTLFVKNLPVETTLAELKKLFPGAVDIKISSAKPNYDTTTATVTMPTPKDATKVKRQKYHIGGNKLILKFSFVKDQTNIKNKQKGKKKTPGQVNGRVNNAKTKHKLQENDDNDNESPSPKKKAKYENELPSLKKKAKSENESPPKKKKSENESSTPEEKAKSENELPLKKKNKNKMNTKKIPFEEGSRAESSNSMGKLKQQKQKPGMFLSNVMGKNNEIKSKKPFKKFNKKEKPFKKQIKPGNVGKGIKAN